MLYGCRQSAPRYFPLEHLVFSATLASQRCPRILGGKEGFKHTNGTAESDQVIRENPASGAPKYRQRFLSV